MWVNDYMPSLAATIPGIHLCCETCLPILPFSECVSAGRPLFMLPLCGMRPCGTIYDYVATIFISVARLA